MILKPASHEAVKYACKHFHYAKRVPVPLCCYSVFNNTGIWCGCIIYSTGASKSLSMQFGLVQGQVAELVRMALNGKQESTSKALAISMKLIKKHNPLLKMLVSFADTAQNHVGTIYQATNWHYTGCSKPSKQFIYKGKTMHARSFMKKHAGMDYHNHPSVKIVDASRKLRYIYPLEKSMLSICKERALPYPKQALKA